MEITSLCEFFFLICKASTVAPLDVLSLIVPPLGGDRTDSRITSGNGGQDDTVDNTEKKTMEEKLFPSQIHKLTLLLTVLAHLRDLLQVR